MIGEFLCGCLMPNPNSLKGDPELKTFDTIEYDAEGFLVCKVHGLRRYGWRAGLFKPDRIDLYPLSDLEVERYLLFDVQPDAVKCDLKYDSTLDRRDNRDPTEVGIAAKAQHSAENFNDPDMSGGYSI